MKLWSRKTVAWVVAALSCNLVFTDGGYIRVDDDSFAFKTAEGERFLPMGAYYIDERHGEIDPMEWWDHFKAESIEADFAMAKRLGCNTLRFSVHFEVLDRSPDNPVVGSAEDFRKCDILLDAAQRNGLALYLQPAIHGSSPQVTPDLYLWEAVVEKVCSRYKDHPAIFCWQLDWENITLVGYEGDREIWNDWVKVKYGNYKTASKAWETDAAADALWDEMRNLNHHSGAFDEKRNMMPKLWYLDCLNDTNDPKLYDWQLFRDHLYTTKITRLLKVARKADPNHLICIDLICWSFPMLRNNIMAGWGGPFGYAAVDVQAISEYVDFFGIHTYPMYMPPFTKEWYENLSRDKQTRKNELRYIGILCRYLRENTGKPIVHSETGWHGGEGDYYNNSEQDQLEWAVDVMEETKHSAIGWINWTLKDIPTHEKLTAFGGMVTAGIKTKPDTENINPLSKFLYASERPADEAYKPKLIGMAFRDLVKRMHTDPDVRPMPGKKAVVSKRFVYTADLHSLDKVLTTFMDDANYPCDVSLEDMPVEKGPIQWAENGNAHPPKPPRFFKEVGGSNYVMYDVDDKYLIEGKGWFTPGVLQPVIATFHQLDKAVVLEQLKAMHASGQQKISILIWHDRMTKKKMDSNGVYGHVLASNGGTLRPQHAQNLKDQLAMVREIGFNELIFRFAQQGDAWPQVWEKWNEEAYLENKAFIFSTRQLVLDSMKGSGMKLTFDLGAELGGIEKGQITPYTERLWRDYTEAFGADDTFGFSIAGHPARIRRWIGICDKVGVRPSRYALDMYGYIPEWMPKMIPEFAEVGVDDPKIIILETFWNDAQALKDLQKVAEDFDFEYEFLMQWPLRRGSAHPHFSDVFDGAEYDAYLNSAK